MATLAGSAAIQPEGADPKLTYRAAFVHDLGRVAVPTGVWEKRGPLNPDEWELVRLHRYHSGRILTRSPVLEKSPISRPVHRRPTGSHRVLGLKA